MRPEELLPTKRTVDRLAGPAGGDQHPQPRQPLSPAAPPPASGLTDPNRRRIGQSPDPAPRQAVAVRVDHMRPASAQGVEEGPRSRVLVHLLFIAGASTSGRVRGQRGAGQQVVGGPWAAGDRVRRAGAIN
jgi:hypothetical protein